MRQAKDGELPYLRKRAGFHRRMARRATCGEARCAHDAFVRAYQLRIDELTCAGQPAAREAEAGRARQLHSVPAPVN